MAIDWKSTLETLAPTVLSAALGPLGGLATAGLGAILGIPDATQDKIAKAIQSGQMTPEQVAKLKEMELQFKADEKERGFRYAELEFKDRADARKANVDGGTQKYLFWLSLALLVATLGSEIAVLFFGYPTTIQEIVVGRVLGLLDAVAMMVLSYWYGTSSGSALKTGMMAEAASKEAAKTP